MGKQRWHGPLSPESEGHSRCGHFTAAAAVHGRLHTHTHAHTHTHTRKRGRRNTKGISVPNFTLGATAWPAFFLAANQSESRMCVPSSLLYFPLPFKNTSTTSPTVNSLGDLRSATPRSWYSVGRLRGMCWIKSQNAQTAARLLVLEVIRSSEATRFNTLPDSRLVQWSNQSEDSGVYRRRVQDVKNILGCKEQRLCVSGKFRAADREIFFPWWTGTAVGCWLPAMMFLPCLLPGAVNTAAEPTLLDVGGWTATHELPVLFQRRQRHPPSLRTRTTLLYGSPSPCCTELSYHNHLQPIIPINLQTHNNNNVLLCWGVYFALQVTILLLVQ